MDKMKKLLVALMVGLLFLGFTGCAKQHVIATRIGVAIGDSYQEAAAMGTVSAEQSIAAWPYISGQLKGLMASNYNIDMPPLITNIIDDLDELAKKETLTTEEKGFVIGSFIRLEAIILKNGLDKYGVSIINMVKGMMGV